MEKKLPPLPTTIEAPKTLEEAKEKINQLADLMVLNWDKFAWGMGLYCLTARDLCEHGTWQKWVEENIKLVSYETALHYIRHYKKCKDAGGLLKYNPSGHWKSRKDASVAVLKAGIPPELPEEEKVKYLKPPSDEEPKPEEETEDDNFMPTEPWYSNKEYKYWSPAKAAKAIIERWGEVTRFRGMEEMKEVGKLVHWYIKRFTDNTEYWLTKYAKEKPLDIDSFEALRERHRESQREIERIWNWSHVNPPGKAPLDDPNWPGPLYTMASGKIITTTEFDEYKKKHLPESESWSDEEIIKRWRIEQND
jgi:hypothetical protein